MPNYHFTYCGGRMAETDEERAAVMQAWTDWFGALGDAVVDPGHPLGPSRTIAPDGAVSEAADVNGYTIISADDLSDAVTKAKGCPLLADGGSVEVGECVEM